MPVMTEEEIRTYAMKFATPYVTFNFGVGSKPT